jgi:hypothetical protein
MIPKYLLKTILVLASGLASQAYASNTSQDPKNSLESMPKKELLDIFNIGEFSLDDAPLNKKSSDQKASLDAIWEVDYSVFNEENPW